MKDNKRKKGWTKKPESKPAIRPEPTPILHTSLEPLPLPTQPVEQEILVDHVTMEVTKKVTDVTLKDIFRKLNPWRFLFGTQENFTPWRVVMGTAIVLIGGLCLVQIGWPYLVQLVSRLF